MKNLLKILLLMSKENEKFQSISILNNLGSGMFLFEGKFFKELLVLDKFKDFFIRNYPGESLGNPK